MNENTSARILSAAKTLLEQGDGQSLRMTDIARQAGISRQALYLHFSDRVSLLIATARFVDDSLDLSARLHESRVAPDGLSRLRAFVEFWGKYLPEIYPVVKTVMGLRDSDSAAKAAWDDRMKALREGCKAIVDSLVKEGLLIDELSPKLAVDLIWTTLSVATWEQLTLECGWTRKQYIDRIQGQLIRLLSNQ